MSGDKILAIFSERQDTLIKIKKKLEICNFFLAKRKALW